MKNKNNLAKLKVFRKIADNIPLAILTGSLALIVNHDIPERACKDIDIVLPYYEDLSHLGKVSRIENPYTTTAMSTVIDGTLVHVIIDPNCLFVNKLTEEGMLKISNSEDAMIEKFKSYVLFDSEKNRKDIIDYIEIQDKKKSIEPDKNIPF